MHSAEALIAHNQNNVSENKELLRHIARERGQFKEEQLMSVCRFRTIFFGGQFIFLRSSFSFLPANFFDFSSIVLILNAGKFLRIKRWDGAFSWSCFFIIRFKNYWRTNYVENYKGLMLISWIIFLKLWISTIFRFENSWTIFWLEIFIDDEISNRMKIWKSTKKLWFQFFEFSKWTKNGSFRIFKIDENI